MKDEMRKRIKEAKKSLFRFEGLQDYSAEDGTETVEQFIKTGSFGGMSWKNDWWKSMKERNERGVKTARVRLVTEPLTDYTKMELAFLKKAAAFSGDDIRVINEAALSRLMLSEKIPSPLQDFWMVDDTYVFLMKYGPNGKFLESHLADESETKKLVALKEKLLAKATKIVDYTTM